MTNLLIRLIYSYQRLAPARLRSCCRFTPSCSLYAIQAYERFGLAKGSRLTFLRLLRCRHPNRGLDEVPENNTQTERKV